MPNPSQWAAARARQALQRTIRARLEAHGYLEVETPLLVPARAWSRTSPRSRSPFVPETDVGPRRTLYLHTSPEYAMKRLLADGAGPIFQLCKVFRNGEVSPTHNPEFTMLEFYRPHADYHAIMEDLEQALAAAGRAARRRAGGPASSRGCPTSASPCATRCCAPPGVDCDACPDARLARAARPRRRGAHGDATSFDDVFFHLFLQKVEPRLGHERPTFLIEYPASMAVAVAAEARGPARGRARGAVRQGAGAGQRLLGADGRGGAARAGSSRSRSCAGALGRPVYPLDERFLEAVGRMPPSAGIAVGLDRMLDAADRCASASTDVLLFPAHEFV